MDESLSRTIVSPSLSLSLSVDPPTRSASWHYRAHPQPWVLRCILLHWDGSRRYFKIECAQAPSSDPLLTFPTYLLQVETPTSQALDPGSYTGRGFHVGLEAIHGHHSPYGRHGVGVQKPETLAGSTVFSRVPAGQAWARAFSIGSGVGPCLSIRCSDGHLAPALRTQHSHVRAAQGPELLGPAGWQSWAGLTEFPCFTMVLPLQDDIAQAASRVCKIKLRLLRGLCKKIMKTVFRRVSQDIMAGKTPHDICVDIKMCKPQAGEY